MQARHVEIQQMLLVKVKYDLKNIHVLCPGSARKITVEL